MLTRQRKDLQYKARGWAAAHAVFDTPELLENIFSHLSMRTLLTSAQRVCRTWNAVIAGSPLLQRLLYFRPQPHSKEDENPNRIQNPLLAEAFPTLFIGLGNTSRECGFRREAFQSSLAGKYAANRRAFMCQNASWRIMLVTQPPIHQLGLWMMDCWNGGISTQDDWRFKVLEFTQGLRMGSIYDRGVRFLGATNHSSMSLYWNPKDPSTLPERHFFFGPWMSFNPAYARRRQEVLWKCGGVVELVIRGERWDNPKTDDPRADAAFRKTFTYLHKNTEKDLLDPVQELAYKPVFEFAEELEAAKSK